MIKSFKNRDTEKIFNHYFSKKYPHDIQRRALLQLRPLHNAGGINDLRNPPSNPLEKLSGDRAEQYSLN